jgi:hypothetical protein
MRPVSRFALLMTALSLAACSGNLSVVGGPDASTDLGPTDLGVLDVGVLDVGVLDVGVLDVPVDTGPADTGPADTGPARCAQDSDCAGNPGGPACDVASGRCVTCTPASDRCPAGQYCVGATNACAPGCRDDASCMGASSDGGVSGSRRCDTTTRACVECLADEHCPSGTLCVGNLCVAGCNAGRACPASQTCCSGACIDAQTNTAHCGACDRRCTVANASPLCLNGTCTVASCVAPFGDCDTSPANGCETDTSRDTAHCGGCGMACAARPNSVASCASGACAYACAMGFADCDGDASNGCEVDTRTSASHCGACGARCAPANATAACVAGVCTVGACATGFGDCDGNATNGCETDLPVSVSHCGACGNRCPANPNAAPVCVAGSCSSVCTAGFADCDSNPATGCEVDVRVDSANCGSCGRACSNVGGTSTCTTGACVLRCTRGRGDCDGNPLNGCEVDLTSSSAHCGGCGVSCDANAACRINEGLSGVCVCNAGYAGSGSACMDVDECLTGNGGCSPNATCMNTIGGRTCTCNTAFTGNGVTCAPVVIELTIAANTTGYNVFLQAGAPMIPRVVQVTVNPGVVVSSTSPSAPAFVSGALRPGSELRIVNRGTITGAGGAGGNGGGYINASADPQSAGSPGGAAISTTVPVVIDNTSGNIWGGGGGGGGGAVATVTNVLGGGGGGGGGAGIIAGAGGAGGPAFSGAQYPVGTAGSPGTATAGGAGGVGGNSGTYPSQFSGGRGIGGTGGAGGNPGLPGARGGDGNLGGTGRPGGAAGNAVALNGAAVTWTGGNNATQVRGPVN